MSPLDREQRRQAARWRALPRERPERIEAAGPGQHSVWDHPRPPRVEAVSAPLRVEFAGRVVAASQRALRVLETASPPTYYLPPDDVEQRWLEPLARNALCEWKGLAHFASLRVAGRFSEAAAWCYPEPLAPYAALRGSWAFFAGRVDACFVGDERVRPQPGDYYGGWITADLSGPFKGEPGSERW